MNNQSVASFYASLGVKIDQRSFAAAERALKRIQEIMAGFNKYKTDLVIKPKVQLNTLQLQKQIQTSLNQVARLTQFKIDRFQVDATRLTSSLESAIRRAQHSAGSIRVRAIAERSPLSQSTRALRHSEGVAGLGGGIGGLVASSRAGVAGIAGYVGYEAIQGIQARMDEIQARAGSYEMQRLQLGAAVGGSEVRRRNNAIALREISDYTGTRAADQVAPYTRFEKQATQAGLAARQAIGLYRNMAVSTRGNGGDQQSIERQAYALQQVLGLGYLRGEELNQQLADSNPSIKRYIQSAYLQRVGFKGNDSQGTEKFMKDLGKRQVLVQDVLRGYELSAQNASKRVEELSNSIEGAAARLDNVKWAENLERSEGELTDAVRDRIAAEKELYEALKPARDMFTELTTQGLKFATWMTNATTQAFKTIDKIPAGTISHGTVPIPGGAYDDPQPGFLTPKKYDSAGSLGEAWDIIASKVVNMLSAPAWGTPGNRIVPEFQSYQPSELLNGMRGTTTTNQQMVQIAPGAFSIEINAANGDINTISGELERSMSEITDRVILNKLSEARFQYPSIGR